MTTIIHRTPGLLDPRSFTVMGMSAKPTTGHPIGQFGTGLKYSLAGLLRSGAEVSIWIGRDHWQFETHDEEFRNESFTRIVAWVRRWGGLRRQRIELPFTTSLGPHWEAWMWLRELHSNTLDEGGETLSSTDMVDTATWEVLDTQGFVVEYVSPRDNTTLIVVTLPDYAAAWDARDGTFHPTASGPSGVGTAILEAIPSGPSSIVYYRGLRVLDLRLPTATCTWNILEATPLTEDRTMHEYYARAAIARWLVCDCVDESLISIILDTDEEHWEHGLEFPHHIRPSDTFTAAAARVRRSHTSPRLSGYLGAWAPATPPDTRPFLERRGRRWTVAEDQLLDERGRPVLSRPEDHTDDDWREFGALVVRAIGESHEDQLSIGHLAIDIVRRHQDRWGWPGLADEELAEYSLAVAACEAGIRAAGRRPSPRPMVVGDLFCAYVLDHDWLSVWDSKTEQYVDSCIQCGTVWDEDTRYDPCSGPSWMSD